VSAPQGGIFDMTGVTRGPDGIKRYDGLPRNLGGKLLKRRLREDVDWAAAARR
jgi:hypothetical protein